MDDESIFDALLEGHDAHWAFGTGFEDPLAGVDTTIPDGVDASDLAAYCLMLGDDALVYGHRLSEWCSRAPDLEEDIALANIALDLIGQARLLLTRAAAADAGIVPDLPDGSPAPAEDRLAYFRDAPAFRNARITELPNGDFGETIARLLVVSTWRLAVFEALRASSDRVLSAIATKGAKELTYHRDFAARWFLTLAQGTEESRNRLEAGLRSVLPFTGELFTAHPIESRLATAGVGAEPSQVAVDAALAPVFTASGWEPPTWTHLSGGSGRDGVHTEALSRLLGEMQVVARAHPLGTW
jgi:ring-1,2-phenylacetyl-CoA epoxidase subunit PaaC